MCCDAEGQTGASGVLGEEESKIINNYYKCITNYDVREKPVISHSVLVYHV